MQLRVVMKNRTVKELEKYDSDLGAFLHQVPTILNCKESEISKVILRVTYSIADKKNYQDFEDDILDYEGRGSVDVKIMSKNDYTFELVLEGKLLDVITFDHYIDPRHRFNLVDIQMRNDITLLDHLLRGLNLHNFNAGSSLILRFLSDKNGGLDNEHILEILRREVKKDSLKQFLPSIFTELYKVAPENAKTRPAEVDKMSLRALHDETLKGLEKELEAMLQ